MGIIMMQMGVTLRPFKETMQTAIKTKENKQSEKKQTNSSKKEFVGILSWVEGNRFLVASALIILFSMFCVDFDQFSKQFDTQYSSQQCS